MDNWSEHADYPSTEWAKMVMAGDTRLGYEDWVDAMRHEKSIGTVVVFEGEHLKDLAEFLAKIHHDVIDSGGVYKVRFAIDGGLKIKCNEWHWTRPLGEIES